MNNSMVIVAEDHPLMRKGIIATVNAISGFEVCGEADSWPVLCRLLAQTPADYLILDIYLHGVCMLEHIGEILKQWEKIAILVISAYDDELYAFHSIRNGAQGFISKTALDGEFKEALQTVRKGAHYLPAHMRTSLTDRLISFGARGNSSRRDKLFNLTVKEMEVFRLLGEGKTTAEIAERLHISPKTVEIHRIHIKTKLGFATLIELVRYATLWTKEALPQ